MSLINIGTSWVEANAYHAAAGLSMRANWNSFVRRNDPIHPAPMPCDAGDNGRGDGTGMLQRASACSASSRRCMASRRS